MGWALPSMINSSMYSCCIGAFSLDNIVKESLSSTLLLNQFDLGCKFPKIIISSKYSTSFSGFCVFSKVICSVICTLFCCGNFLIEGIINSSLSDICNFFF